MQECTETNETIVSTKHAETHKTIFSIKQECRNMLRQIKPFLVSNEGFTIMDGLFLGQLEHNYMDTHGGCLACLTLISF